MKLFLYSIYDEKVKTFGTPFFKPTTPSATRDFGDLATDRQSMVGRHPEDYSLYQIGEYDDQTALVTPIEPPVNLGKADQFIEI